MNVHALAARSCARDPQDHLAPSPCARRCEESKAEANALFKRGDAVRARHVRMCACPLAWRARRPRAVPQARANRRYKKAMLDLEVPTQWAADDNVRRNQARPEPASPPAHRRAVCEAAPRRALRCTQNRHFCCCCCCRAAEARAASQRSSVRLARHRRLRRNAVPRYNLARLASARGRPVKREGVSRPLCETARACAT